MAVIQYLMDTPAVSLVVLLLVLAITVPFLRRKRPDLTGDMGGEKERPTTRFLGTQMDVILLLFAAAVLLALAGPLYNAVFKS